MLDFFRKYQSYFFMVITVVIIISFSFFGTYETITSQSDVWREQVAFTAVNGHDVTRYDVEEMSQFLATDAQDKLIYGGLWGPNFLNDGVIRKDILQKGVGEAIILSYPELFQEDLNTRLAKEKKSTLYSHPEARFVGVESVWSYFAPEMNGHYRSLKASSDPLSKEAVKNRVFLFLGSKELPSNTLRYLLNYQEQQYSWIKPDPNLRQIDLSLFGYHTIEEWFGPAFTRLSSEFIINCAILAEQKGYSVSKEEALADLLMNTKSSYDDNKDNPNIGVASFQDYFSEQLRRMNMDQSTAVRIWQQILLFRRYFEDIKNQPILDASSIRMIRSFAGESITVDVYRLPKTLRIGDFESLQELEAYLYAATKQDKQNPLVLSKEYLPIEQIEKKYPELIQKKYDLEVKKASSADLLPKVSLKDLWKWEESEENWKLLKKEFTAIAQKKAATEEERAASLDELDPATRTKIDRFAKEQILKNHPEWIEEVFSRAKPETMTVSIRKEGGKAPFPGIDTKEQREAFTKLLDDAPLNESPSVDSPLAKYSPDKSHFYQIKVIGRSGNKEILTFGEAQKEGALKSVNEKILEKHYNATKEQSPALYKDKEKWKSFSTVKTVVADSYYDKIMQLVQDNQKTLPSDAKDKSKDKLAAYRLYSNVEGVQKQLKENLSTADSVLDVPKEEAKDLSLANQWKLEKTREVISRENNRLGEDFAKLIALKPGEWSSLKVFPTGEIVFFQLINKEYNPTENEAVIEQIRALRDLIGQEAENTFMMQTVELLKEKGAFSLSYLKKEGESGLNASP